MDLLSQVANPSPCFVFWESITRRAKAGLPTGYFQPGGQVNSLSWTHNKYEQILNGLCMDMYNIMEIQHNFV